MKAKSKRTATRRKIAPQYITRNGRRMVLLFERDFERLCQEADLWEPLLPPPDSQGNFPAVATARVSLARKILRHRRRMGLTQAELAKRAGIRAETLNRIERGERSPSIVTVEKIEAALRAAENA